MPISSFKPHLFKILKSLKCTEAKLKVKAPQQDIDITFGNWGSPIKMNKNPAQQLAKMIIFDSGHPKFFSLFFFLNLLQ